MHRLCWGWHFSIRSLWISRRKLLTTTAWAICIYCDVYVVSSRYESSVSKSYTWLCIIWGIVFSQIFFTWFLRPNFVISSHLQRSLVKVLRPSEWSVSTGEAYHWHKPNGRRATSTNWEFRCESGQTRTIRQIIQKMSRCEFRTSLFADI